MRKSAISRLMSRFGSTPAAPGKKRGRPPAEHPCPKCGATITRAQLDRKAPHDCAQTVNVRSAADAARSGK